MQSQGFEHTLSVLNYIMRWFLFLQSYRKLICAKDIKIHLEWKEKQIASPVIKIAASIGEHKEDIWSIIIEGNSSTVEELQWRKINQHLID